MGESGLSRGVLQSPEKSVHFANPDSSEIETLTCAQNDAEISVHHVEDFFGVQKCQVHKGLPKFRKLKILTQSSGKMAPVKTWKHWWTQGQK